MLLRDDDFGQDESYAEAQPRSWSKFGGSSIDRLEERRRYRPKDEEKSWPRRTDASVPRSASFPTEGNRGGWKR
jgi:hypothetical protein